MLLRVPGIGTVSARRILISRRARSLRHEDLAKIGVVMKRAQYFITCNHKMAEGLRFSQESLQQNLIAYERQRLGPAAMEQLSLF